MGWGGDRQGRSRRCLRDSSPASSCCRLPPGGPPAQVRGRPVLGVLTSPEGLSWPEGGCPGLRGLTCPRRVLTVLGALLTLGSWPILFARPLGAQMLYLLEMGCDMGFWAPGSDLSPACP